MPVVFTIVSSELKSVFLARRAWTKTQCNIFRKLFAKIYEVQALRELIGGALVSLDPVERHVTASHGRSSMRAIVYAHGLRILIAITAVRFGSGGGGGNGGGLDTLAFEGCEVTTRATLTALDYGWRFDQPGGEPIWPLWQDPSELLRRDPDCAAGRASLADLVPVDAEASVNKRADGVIYHWYEWDIAAAHELYSELWNSLLASFECEPGIEICHDGIVLALFGTNVEARCLARTDRENVVSNQGRLCASTSSENRAIVPEYAVEEAVATTRAKIEIDFNGRYRRYCRRGDVENSPRDLFDPRRRWESEFLVGNLDDIMVGSDDGPGAARKIRWGISVRNALFGPSTALQHWFRTEHIL